MASTCFLACVIFSQYYVLLRSAAAIYQSTVSMHPQHRHKDILERVFTTWQFEKRYLCWFKHTHTQKWFGRILPIKLNLKNVQSPWLSNRQSINIYIHSPLSNIANRLIAFCLFPATSSYSSIKSTFIHNEHYVLWRGKIHSHVIVHNTSKHSLKAHRLHN